MFKTLLIKEWKDKALLVAFGLGIMGLMLTVFLVFRDDQDLRELIPATFLIFFFPVIGVMLGAGAFESEFRDGAWTYLLSRPVRKEMVWSAKLVALLSILAGFWLIFAGLMAVVPGLGDVVTGFSLPEMLGSGLSFFPLMLASSLFFFSIAFSFSILTDRQLSLVFGSLFLGIALQSILTYFAVLAQGRGMLTQAGRFPVLDAFKLALVLSSLAFLAASLIAFLKTDFSQPKRKAQALAKWCFLFLAAAWAMSAAWPALRPGPREEIESGIDIEGNEAFLSTNRGLYRYDLESDRFKKIVRWRGGYCLAGGGKVLYVVWDSFHEGPALWAANSDGSDKRLLVGGRPRDSQAFLWFPSPRLSPDGKTAVFYYEEITEASARTPMRSLASVGTDGTGLKKLAPLDPGMVGNGEERAPVAILAWLKSPEGLLMWARPLTIGRPPKGVWRYDLTTGAQTKLLEYSGSISLVPNPAANMALLIIGKEDSMGPIDISLLDLKTGTTTPVTTIERAEGQFLRNAIGHSGWSGDGDRVGFLIRQKGGLLMPAVYSREEHRFVMGPGIPPQASQDSSLELGWTRDGTKLVVTAVPERSLYFLGPDLGLAKKVLVPPSVSGPFRAWPIGDAVLVSDHDNEAVWRLDLKTEKWKKVW